MSCSCPGLIAAVSLLPWRGVCMSSALRFLTASCPHAKPAGLGLGLSRTVWFVFPIGQASVESWACISAFAEPVLGPEAVANVPWPRPSRWRLGRAVLSGPRCSCSGEDPDPCPGVTGEGAPLGPACLPRAQLPPCSSLETALCSPLRARHGTARRCGRAALGGVAEAGGSGSAHSQGRQHS